MSPSLRFDETDLLLVNALQFAPRASWSRLREALGIDPATLSERWQSLTHDGLAWTTCYPSLQRWSTAFAYVEVAVTPGTRDDVFAEIVNDPQTLSVEFTTGRRDLFLTIAMPDITAIDRYVSERLTRVPGIISTRTHHVRRIYVDGGAWRLHVLPPAARNRVAALNPEPAVTGPVPRLSDLEQSVITALGGDARRSASSIADELGVSVSAVTRAIHRLLVTRRITLRCDIAHNFSPWKVIAVLWISVPHDQLSSLVGAMTRHPPVRQCSSLVGEANLMVQTWMRSLGELDTIEQSLSSQFPNARVLDRWIVSHNPKRLGNVLDERGLRERFVPFTVEP